MTPHQPLRPPRVWKLNVDLLGIQYGDGDLGGCVSAAVSRARIVWHESVVKFRQIGRDHDRFVAHRMEKGSRRGRTSRRQARLVPQPGLSHVMSIASAPGYTP
jgi:hypothetical protein